MKKGFDEEVIESYDDESLARLLFVDGCTLIQFIDYFVRNKFKELRINRGQAEMINQDLFLLENQIPFHVLSLLLESSKMNA